MPPPKPTIRQTGLAALINASTLLKPSRPVLLPQAPPFASLCLGTAGAVSTVYLAQQTGQEGPEPPEAIPEGPLTPKKYFKRPQDTPLEEHPKAQRASPDAAANKECEKGIQNLASKRNVFHCFLEWRPPEESVKKASKKFWGAEYVVFSIVLWQTAAKRGCQKDFR